MLLLILEREKKCDINILTGYTVYTENIPTYAFIAVVPQIWLLTTFDKDMLLRPDIVHFTNTLIQSISK